MIRQDHVFNYGPKSAGGVTKFQEKKTGEALANFDAERGISNHIPLSASKFASYLGNYNS